MACVNRSTGRIIYMDNAATTRLYDEALEAMMPYLKDGYANPSGVYDFAQEAAKAAAGARFDIADAIGARPNEIYFTSGGTESDNWAVKGIVSAARSSAVSGYGRKVTGEGRPHIITSAIEHHAVLNTCRQLEDEGCMVSYVNPNSDGIIPVDEIESLICDETVLISVMFANNEIGTLQPVKEIGALAREHKIPFHTDAVAALGHIPINVKDAGIDLMSASAHKFGGPKGVGFLYVNEAIKLPPLMHGGAQEQGRRAGTINVPGVVGMAAAVLKNQKDMDENLVRMSELGDHFMDQVEAFNAADNMACGHIRINGCIKNRIPGSYSLTIPGISSEPLIVRLGEEGICVSAGAACATLEGSPSHVLKAIGLTKDEADSSMRISMSPSNMEEEIDILFEALGRLTNKEAFR
ncbi:MAG: cysteine desulfurase [Lachnospiraceae bacterium]|nr:cysteine desulfurase [Lachnospiraceae bacterium]